MNRKLRIVLALLVFAALFGYREWKQRATQKPQEAAAPAKASDAPPAKAERLGSLSFKPCTLAAPFGGEGLEAQCGTMDVPEDRANPGGRKIRLNIAWIPASEGAEVQPDPVFFLAGGPGQSAVKGFPQLAPVFDRVLRKRHVILVDQRGTGESHPLNCKIDDDAGDATDLAALARLTETCRDALAKDADLRQYGTTAAVEDLDAVRAAIGAPQLNLVGVSYGTRVAQQYAMRHPDRTRTITLDSTVPNTLVLGNIWARNLDDALAKQFALCSADAACKEKLGDPRAELDALMQKLRAAPVKVTYRDSDTGESLTEPLTAMEVAGLVRMYAYMPAMAALLPLQIHEASEGRYGTLKALSKMLSDAMEDQMANGMQLSVVCAEDGDGIVGDAANEGTVLGNSLTDGMATMCKSWPRGKVPADFHQPLSTPVPALVIAGEFDPVTPPKYGEEVVRTLPNGRLFVLKGQGHNVIGAGCMPRLFAQFVDKADAKALDAKCLAAIVPMAPFQTFNGAQP